MVPRGWALTSLEQTRAPAGGWKLQVGCVGTSDPRDLSFLPHHFINHFSFAYLRASSQVQLAAQRWDEWKEASCQVTSSLAGPFPSAYPATQQVQALELPQPHVDISLDSGGQRAYRCIWGRGKTDVLSRISILREFGKYMPTGTHTSLFPIPSSLPLYS